VPLERAAAALGAIPRREREPGAARAAAEACLRASPAARARAAAAAPHRDGLVAFRALARWDSCVETIRHRFRTDSKTLRRSRIVLQSSVDAVAAVMLYGRAPPVAAAAAGTDEGGDVERSEDVAQAEQRLQVLCV